jgi:hypothetical protein
VKGSLLLIRHLPDGTKYRIRSNALDGLAIQDAEEDGETFGAASFSGKATYLQPGWVDAEGNHSFVAYVEDRAEPGKDVDRLWIQAFDKDGAGIPVMSMDDPATENAETISGGNVTVPHGGGGGRNR